MRFHRNFGYALFLASVAANGQSQQPAALADRGITLVEAGRCAEALPLLERAMPKLSDPHLRYSAAMAQARCAMALDRQNTALSSLLQLRREFPDDAEVLYVTAHYLSQMAMTASRELAAKSPNSPQAIRLEAEAFESQGKWDEAEGLYRGILQREPKTPGIHYRLGQLSLSRAGETGPTDAARSEFEKELEIDPRNAAAEYMLGQLAQKSAQWEEARAYFLRATQQDAGFAEAYLGLGQSLAALGQFSQAVSPLEAYVKMTPDDPAGHYQLAIAYRRSGNMEGAARELEQQKRVQK